MERNFVIIEHMLKEISVVLPAFNEEENIEKQILDVANYLKTKFKTYEIIVVNNGSRDRTKQLIQKLQKRNKHIKLINLPVNRGYGAGLRAGFKQAKKELVFYTDSDNQFNIKELHLLLPLIKKYDIVCGYRKRSQDPMMRIFIASVYNLIINLLFHVDVKDIDCSFKLYKKKIFDSMTLHSDTGLIDAEILIKAKKTGFTIGPQIPITHYPRTLGQTMYEVGPRGKIFAFVRPEVIFEIFVEIKKMWKELK